MSTENIKTVLNTFHTFLVSKHRIANTMEYSTFEIIFKHYIMCVLDRTYIDSVTNTEIQNIIKSFNVVRGNIVSELLTKFKYKNPNMFVTLSWIYKSYKIRVIESEHVDSKFCYLSGEKIPGKMNCVYIYIPSQLYPKSICVSKNVIVFLYSFFMFTHIENEIQSMFKEWVTTQQWYYCSGVSFDKKYNRFHDVYQSYYCKQLYIQYINAIKNIEQSSSSV